MSSVIARIQRRLSRSRLAAFVAVKLRNQARAVVGQRMADGIDPSTNGEDLVLSVIAPMCKSFIDVGANVGEWTARFLASNPAAEGLLVEPNSAACAALRERFTSNDKLKIVQVAAGDAEGVGHLHIEGKVGQTSSLLDGVVTNVASVQVVPIQTLAQLTHGSAYDLLKVDAEGYDLKVLLGAAPLLGQLKFIQFEYNAQWVSGGGTLARALQLLKEHGYEVRLIKRDGLYQFDYSFYGEFFWYSNFLAMRDPQSLSALFRGAI